MEAKTNKTCRQYLRKVKRALSCSRPVKTLAIRDLRERITEYVDGYKGEVTVEHLEECFGTPAEVGESFFSKNDLAALKKRANRYIWWQLLAISSLICLVFTIYLVAFLIEHQYSYTIISPVYK